MKTLYKKDSKGKLRFWSISTEGPELIQESGIVGTDSPVRNSKVAKAKNIGRSNETTPEEQAVLEMESKIKKKLDKAYFETKDEAINEEVILPMLAKDYKKEKKKIDWTKCLAQPKLDGMRCLAVIKDGSVVLISRGGKKIENMNHVIKDLEGLDDMVLDGELYVHGESFQQNMKYIKKYREGLTERISFNVYDFFSDLPVAERVFEVTDLVNSIDSTNITTVDTVKVSSEDELEKIHEKWISEGYEGSMVRWGEAGYKVNGRSSNLLKNKDFIDIALPILDVIPNDQRPDHGSFVFEWEGAVGHPLGDDIIGCGMRFSHDEREYILNNKEEYIGKTAELRFFEYSDTGVPRFPVCVGLRLDK